MSNSRHRSLPWWGAVLLVGVALGGTRLVLLLAAAIQMLRRQLPLQESLRQVALDPLNLGLAQGAAFVAALGLGFRLFRRGDPVPRVLKIRPVHGGIVLLAFIAGFALQFPLRELANLLYELHPMPVPEQLRLRRLITPDGAIDGLSIIFAVVVMAPVTEELLFRGFALPALQRRYGVRFALVFTSVLFGITHMAHPAAMVYSTVAGFILGAVAIRTGSTLPAVAMHAAINAAPVMLSERVVRIHGFNTIGEEVHHLSLPIVISTGLIAAAALIALMRLSDLEAR